VRVLDLRGAVVRELPATTYGGGAHEVVWDGRGDSGDRLPAGVYFIELRVSGTTRGARIALVQ
jgi:flagellar hook assembly protein FlgD